MATSLPPASTLSLMGMNLEPNRSFERILKYIREVARLKKALVQIAPTTINRHINGLMSAHEACNRVASTALDHCYQVGRMLNLAETLGVLDEIGLVILERTRADAGFFAYQAFGMSRMYVGAGRHVVALATLALLPTNQTTGRVLDLFRRVALAWRSELDASGRPLLMALMGALADGHGVSGQLYRVPQAPAVLAARSAVMNWLCNDDFAIFRHDFAAPAAFPRLPESVRLVVAFLDALFRSPAIHDAAVVADWRERVPATLQPLFDQYVQMHLPDAQAAAANGDLGVAQKTLMRAFMEANVEQATRRADVSARLPPELVGKVFGHLYHDDTPVIAKPGTNEITTPFKKMLASEARNAVFNVDLEREAMHDMLGAYQVLDTAEAVVLPGQPVRERVTRERDTRPSDDDDDDIYEYDDGGGGREEEEKGEDVDMDMDTLEKKAADMRVSSSSSSMPTSAPSMHAPSTKRNRLAGRAAALAQIGW